MGERPTIAFRVGEGQKETWEEYAEDNEEYDSLSHLIRVAVTHEMSEQYGPDGGTGDTNGDTDMGQVTTTLEDVTKELDALRTSVKDATDAMYEGSTSVSDSVSGEVFEALPLIETPQINHETGEYDGSTPDLAMYPQDVAKKIDRDTPTVAVALEQLERATGSVKKTHRVASQGSGIREVAMEEDTPVYWREP